MQKMTKVKKSDRKKKGEVIVAICQATGVQKVFRKHKNVPKNCSAPKQICIECMTAVIRKNDLNYNLKVCKECMGNRA